MDLYGQQHKSLVDKIKQTRLDTGMSQNELALKLGKTQSFISKLENGQVKVDVLLLNELSKIYKKGINYFLEETK